MQRSKRSRRSDPSSLEPPPPPNSLSLTGVERRKAKQKRYECTVCEKKGKRLQRISNAIAQFKRQDV